LVGRLVDIATRWPSICQALEQAGHVLNATKSEIWIPGGDDIPTSALPPSVQTMMVDLPRTMGGLKVMGCAAQGDFESMLGPMQKRLQPAGERLMKSQRLAMRIAEYMHGANDRATLHTAWYLTTKSLKEALTYDIRTCPPEAMRPLLVEHEANLRTLVNEICGVKLTDMQWQRVQLPGPLGGMGVRTTLAAAEAAYVATYQALATRVATVCAALGRPTRANIGKMEAEAATRQLRTKGVIVHPNGKVTFSDAACESYRSGPWSKDTTLQALLDYEPKKTNVSTGQGTKVHARIMRALESLQATSLYNGCADRFGKEQFLSAGGNHTGKLWTSVPQSAAAFFDNDHFRMAVQLRLGCVTAPESSVCKIANTAGEECLQRLTTPVTHPHLCKYGPARLRPHGSLIAGLKHQLLKVGAQVDVERAVPFLYRVGTDGKVQEAILDIVTSFPGGLHQEWMDITIRCPHAERYEKASVQAGAASSDGELEKYERYGQEVTTVSYETYGRLGRDSQIGLRQLAHAASLHSVRARGVTAGQLYARWRLELERILLYETADIVLLSLGHSTGVHARRSKTRHGQGR